MRRLQLVFQGAGVSSGLGCGSRRGNSLVEPSRIAGLQGLFRHCAAVNSKASRLGREEMADHVREGSSMAVWRISHFETVEKQYLLFAPCDVC